MKELSALFLAIVAIVFIHATNKSEAKNPVEKKKNNDQNGNRREIEDKTPGYPVAAFASHSTSVLQRPGFDRKFSLQNPLSKKEMVQSSVVNRKGYLDTTNAVLSNDPTYLFYYQRFKFSREITSDVK